MMLRIAGLSALMGAALTLPPGGSASPAAATCGPAALADGSAVTWDTDSAVTGDFDMDGEQDVAWLGRDAEKALVMIAACQGEEVRRRWMFAVPPEPCMAPPRLEAASLLMDEEVVARTCASPTSRSECDHLRRTNRERQARMDAGARALRIASAGCPGMVLEWAADLGGFVRRPG